MSSSNRVAGGDRAGGRAPAGFAGADVAVAVELYGPADAELHGLVADVQGGWAGVIWPGRRSCGGAVVGPALSWARVARRAGPEFFWSDLWMFRVSDGRATKIDSSRRGESGISRDDFLSFRSLS
jgi:hypothetical protein